MKTIARVVLATAVGVAAGLGYALARRTLQWRYQAVSLVKVAPAEGTVLEGRHGQVGPEIMEREKRNAAALVKTKRVLLAALEDGRLQNTEWYREQGRGGDALMRELEKALHVTAVPDTAFIRISMSGKRKDDLADIVNIVVEHFVRWEARRAREQRDVRLRELMQQRDALNVQLETLHKDRSSILANSPLIGGPQGCNLVVVRLEALTRLLVEAEWRVARAEAELKAAASEAAAPARPDDAKPTPQRRPDSGPARDLEDTLRELEHMIPGGAAPDEGPPPAHLPAAVRDKRRALAIAQEEVRHLLDRYRSARTEARVLEESAARVEAYTRRIALLQEQQRALEQAVLNERLAARLAGDATAGRVSVAQPATTPLRAVGPSWPTPTILGAIAGFAIGLVWALAAGVARKREDGPAGGTE